MATTFDLRPYGVNAQASDGQLYHSEDSAADASAMAPYAAGPKPQVFENCTFEAARETVRDLHGGTPMDDEQMRDYETPGWTGGENWLASQDIIQRFLPGVKATIEYPSDVAATIRQYGAQGFIVHVAFWCDGPANVPPQGAVVGSHAERALYATPTTIGFQNVWPHPVYELTDAQVNSLYDGGGILVIRKSVIPPTPPPQPPQPTQGALQRMSLIAQNPVTGEMTELAVRYDGDLLHSYSHDGGATWSSPNALLGQPNQARQISGLLWTRDGSRLLLRYQGFTKGINGDYCEYQMEYVVANGAWTSPQATNLWSHA